jgi:hypothetical protein
MAETPITPSDRRPPAELRSRPLRSAAARSIAVGVALVAAVGITTLNDGGFDAASQSMFVALAGVALLASCSLDGRAVSAAARSRLVLALVGIAALSLASTAWTLDGRTAAFRAALVVSAYAAVFVAAATLAKRTGPQPFAAAVAALALIEAMLGLHAVAMHSLPDAERIYGVWRPGGTFQYPPALAVLEVCALPALSSLLNHRSLLVAGGAAATATLAGATLGLSQSRLGLAMAAVLLTLMVFRPADKRSQRVAAIATAAFVVIGALIAPTLLGGHVTATTPGKGWSGAAEIAGLAAALGVAWLLTRRASSGRIGCVLTATGCVAAVALVTLVWAGDKDARSTSTGPALHRSLRTTRKSDLLHGRGHEWQAALETWSDHPLLGAGAGAYYTASLAHQGPGPTRYAHDLPLELTAELGVLGLLLGVAIYVSAARIIARAINTPGLWLLAPTVVAFLASNLVDWTWHLAGLGALWAATAGAMQGCTQDSAHQELPAHN